MVIEFVNFGGGLAVRLVLVNATPVSNPRGCTPRAGATPCQSRDTSALQCCARLVREFAAWGGIDDDGGRSLGRARDVER